MAKTSASTPLDPSLSVDVTQPGPCQQRVKIRMASPGVQPVRDLVVGEFQREATIAGFRKGKAPRQLVEQKFPSEIREETVKRLTHQVLEQVTTERKLKPVGPFEVIKLDFDEGKGLELEAQVEVEPEFKLADYRGIPIKQPSAAVTPDEVAKALEQLRDSSAELVPAAEGQPKEKRVPNLDDEFAKDVGFENVEALRRHLEAKLKERTHAQQRQEMEQALCDTLLSRHTFDVPPGLVSKQTDRLARDFQVRLMLSGRTEEQVKEELAKYTEQLRTNAVRLVKLAFILERIADKDAITVTQDELVDRLWKMAKQSGKDPGAVKAQLDKQGLWPSVLSSIRQDKTVQHVIEAAKIETVSSNA